MKKNRNKTINLGGTRIYKKDAYELYQELCDRVFGKDAVKIAAAPANNVTGLLRYAETKRTNHESGGQNQGDRNFHTLTIHQYTQYIPSGIVI